MTANTGAKNIVLLSDGTGNSSAKLMKTNVWRLYEAIELSAGDQVALYDNGVGTSSFKLFAVLGGALGWGLKRNVRTLYMFACHNYTPPSDGEPDDQIFTFGFSRGAFTIRVLLGLIQHQGLITGVKGRELERQAKWAYREYRRQFNATKGLVTPLRALRDWLLRTWERRQPYTSTNNVRPRVAFMGLFDTVDAYGLPMDEMTRGWDQWVWPLSLCDHARPPIVDKVCHAIALDDERHTFHPVLLDESTEPASAHTDHEPLTQVWFAGMHCNVGGGYPDDSLAYVPLGWMAGEARKRGLRLHPHVTAEWSARADPNGPASNSRGGLGSYYRYNPRSIKKLTGDRFADVKIPRPKIHESAFRRIIAGRDDYAPIVVPDYAVVTADGTVLHGASNPYEDPTQSQSRGADQERVWNDVWWRRVTYFATVILTFLMIVPPFLFGADGGGVLHWRSRALTGLVDLLGRMVPQMAQPWVEYYRNYPLQLVIGSGVVGGLLIISSKLQRSVGDGMRSVWDAIIKEPPTPVRPSAPPTDWVYRLRSHPWYRGFFDLVTRRLFPFVFGFGALAAVVLIAVGTANRASFATASAIGWTCRDVRDPPPWYGEPRMVSLRSNELCEQTGLVLQAGQRSHVEIALPKGQWFDSTIPVPTPAGFGSGEHSFVFFPFLPFRRVLTTQWFVPLVRIGSYGAEYHTLDTGFAEFTPRRTGQLFLFVNDAIGVGPWLKTFYENNRGTAKVTVKQYETEAVGTIQ